MLLASSGYKPGRLLNIPQSPGQPPTTNTSPAQNVNGVEIEELWSSSAPYPALPLIGLIVGKHSSLLMFSQEANWGCGHQSIMVFTHKEMSWTQSPLRKNWNVISYHVHVPFGGVFLIKMRDSHFHHELFLFWYFSFWLYYAI